jgi:hypothetical protein
MKRGIRLNFNAGGAAFDFLKPVSGKGCTVQNCMVNIATMQGSDKTYPDKGTNLLVAGVRGALINTQSAAHHSNFAALDTISFHRKHAPADAVGLLRIRLQPSAFNGSQLELDCAFEFADGTRLGATTGTN